MTQRLPEGADPQEVAEQRLDEAAAGGELEVRSAWHGRPLDLSDANDPDWWVKRRLREEQLVSLPPALQLRRDRDELLAGLDRIHSEVHVREVLGKLDARIRYALGHAIPGPPSMLLPLDVEALVEQWRAGRPPPPVPVRVPPRRRWWQRVLRLGRRTTR